MKPTPASTLIAVTVALATLLLLEPTANALVHRMSLSHLRVPESNENTSPRSRHASEHPLTRLAKHHGLDRASFQQRIQQETTAPAASSDDCSTGGNGSGASSGGAQASLSTESGYMMVAEANIGTEAQGPFVVEVDFWSHQLYVLGTGAKYANNTGRVHNKQLYNSSASSTYASADADFAANWEYLSGSVGVDVVTIGALNANISLQVTKKVDGWLRDVDIDGTLGLGLSDAKDGSSLVEQLAPQLDSPVITYHIREPWYDWKNYEDAPEGSGVLSFGDLASDTCDSATWASLTSSWKYADDLSGMPIFDITSISRPASGDACDSAVQANITVLPVSYFMPFYVSYQVQQLFVKASGAKWDQDAWAYVVEDASKAQPVTMQLASGATIQLTADDYLITSTDGTQILYVVGFYNQDKYASSDVIFFPQQFINNRCFSMNANSGSWSIAKSMTQTEAVRTSTSSSSSEDD